MNELHYLGIDHGNRKIKSSAGDYFLSGITYHKDKEPLITSNLLVYNGEYFTIGENRVNFQFDKSESNDFYLLTLCCLASKLKSEQKTEGNFCLGVGLPLSSYHLKEKFANYLKKDAIEFQYEGINYKNINIRKVFVYPQSYGGYLSVYNEFKDVSQLTVIDVGSVTVNVLVVEKGRLITNRSLGLNKGIIFLHKKIQNLLIKENIKIEEEQIEDVIRGETPIFFSDEIKTIILSAAKEYLDEVIAEIKENQFDLFINPCIFLGGGSKLLEKYIMDKKDVSVIAVLDQFANANSFEMLAKQSDSRR
jgi:plasmid segregation protein ParM